MPHIVLVYSQCIMQNTFRVYPQDSFGPVDLLSCAFYRALRGQSPVLQNKHQRRVKLCRKRALQSNHHVEAYFEIVEDRKGQVMFCFAYLYVLPLLACG